MANVQRAVSGKRNALSMAVHEMSAQSSSGFRGYDTPPVTCHMVITVLAPPLLRAAS